MEDEAVLDLEGELVLGWLGCFEVDIVEKVGSLVEIIMEQNAENWQLSIVGCVCVDDMKLQWVWFTVYFVLWGCVPVELQWLKIIGLAILGQHYPGLILKSNLQINSW